jgi:hypothetical protein
LNRADSLSLDPRNSIVWQEAARKVFIGSLSAVFIECSYDNTQPDAALYGHLSPNHLISELKVLAKYVGKLKMAKEKEREKLKRKRTSNGYFNEDPTIDSRRRNNPNPPNATCQGFGIARDTVSTLPSLENTEPNMEMDISPRTSITGPGPTGSFDGTDQDRLKPLEGLQIVITHMKDTLTDADIPAKILAELEALEEEAKLGCTFRLAIQGGSIYF